MKKRNILVCILVLILILAMILGVVTSLRKKEAQKSIPTNETEEKSNLSTEADILEENSSDKLEVDINDFKSISAESTEPFKGYRFATEADKANYEITNIKMSRDSKITSVNGKIKNNGSSEKIVLKVEFKENGNVKSSSSIEINDLKINQVTDFEIKILNNVATDDYTVYVEYVGE